MGSLVVITTNEDPTTGFPESTDHSNSIQSTASGSNRTSGTSTSGSRPSTAESEVAAPEPPPVKYDASFGADPSTGLFPGLPDEVALRVLAFLPYLRRMTLSLVCKAWRNAFRSAAVYNIRHQTQKLEEVLCLSFTEASRSSSRSDQTSSAGIPTSLSLKLLDAQRWRWLPLPSEYKHTKCKVRSFQCRALQHRVFVFSHADWAALKEANWPSAGQHGAPLEIPDVVPCGGNLFARDGHVITRYSAETEQWEPVAHIPKRRFQSGSFRQKYFLVAFGSRLGLIDVWQERWFWRPGKVRASISLLDPSRVVALEDVIGEREHQGENAKWESVHRPVGNSGKDVAGFAVFCV